MGQIEIESLCAQTIVVEKWKDGALRDIARMANKELLTFVHCMHYDHVDSGTFLKIYSEPKAIE